MEGLKAPILFQENPDANQTVVWMILKGTCASNVPFFIGIDILVVTTYILSFN